MLVKSSPKRITPRAAQQQSANVPASAIGAPVNPHLLGRFETVGRFVYFIESRENVTKRKMMPIAIMQNEAQASMLAKTLEKAAHRHVEW